MELERSGIFGIGTQNGTPHMFLNWNAERKSTYFLELEREFERGFSWNYSCSDERNCVPLEERVDFEFGFGQTQNFA